MENKFFQLSPRVKRICFGSIILGLICFALGLYLYPQRAWISYLVNVFYFVSLGLGGFFLFSLQNVANASWSRPFTRIMESFGNFLPLGFIFALGLIFGIHTLYEWSHHEIVVNDHILLAKSPYLNMPFFIIRMITFFVLWIVLSKILSSLTRKQNETGDVSYVNKITRYSVIFMIVFAFSYSFFSYDFIMSLEPHWFSTIFGIYTFSGLFVNTLAVMTLTTIYLQHKGHFKDVINENHYHDLGKLIFGFTTFWAYIWFSQYLLIWYSNIPEETQYFYLRENYTWDWLFYFNLAINWLVPFLSLMTRASKRSTFILIRVCILLLIGHWLDLYLMIAPNVFKHAHIENPVIGWVELGMAIGFAGVFILVVGQALKKRALLVKGDPYLEEGIHLHQ